MKTKSSVLIQAPLAQVWAAVADPQTWPRWQTKLKRIQRSRQGLVATGEQFQATFQISQASAALEDSLEILASQEPSLLILQHGGGDGPRRHQCQITLRLHPQDDGVRVDLVSVWRQDGLPFWARCLVAFIHRFGRAQGPGPLDELKSYLENKEVRDNAA